MRRNISTFLIVMTVLAGIVNGDSGHGTHTAGTIGAVGNNGVYVGGNGRDVLVGGAGVDRAGGVPTGSVVFFTGLEVAVSGIQMLINLR